MTSNEIAFHTLMLFASTDERTNYVKFHKNTGGDSSWKCYFGQYGTDNKIVWVKSGRGNTIFDAAFEAINSDKKFL